MNKKLLFHYLLRQFRSKSKFRMMKFAALALAGELERIVKCFQNLYIIVIYFVFHLMRNHI